MVRYSTSVWCKVARGGVEEEEEEGEGEVEEADVI
jgi:hypothetical protein